MAKKAAQKAPALIAEELNPFGDVGDTVLPSGVRDETWVQGYSDIRFNRDRAIAQGKRPEPLPFRLHYVNSKRATGQADNAKISEFRTKGYETVKYDDCLKQFNIDPSKSGFVRNPDGTCGLGDQVLMIAPKEVAAYHAKAQRDDTRALSEGARGKLDEAVAQYNAANPNAPTSVIYEESLHPRQ